MSGDATKFLPYGGCTFVHESLNLDSGKFFTQLYVFGNATRHVGLVLRNGDEVVKMDVTTSSKGNTFEPEFTPVPRGVEDLPTSFWTVTIVMLEPNGWKPADNHAVLSLQPRTLRELAELAHVISSSRPTYQGFFRNCADWANAFLEGLGHPPIIETNMDEAKRKGPELVYFGAGAVTKTFKDAVIEISKKVATDKNLVSEGARFVLPTFKVAVEGADDVVPLVIKEAGKWDDVRRVAFAQRIGVDPSTVRSAGDLKDGIRVLEGQGQNAAAGQNIAGAVTILVNGAILVYYLHSDVSDYQKGLISKKDVAKRTTRNVASTGAGWAGATYGAVAGTAWIPIPVVGSIIGGLVGGMLGSFITASICTKAMDIK